MLACEENILINHEDQYHVHMVLEAF